MGDWLVKSLILQYLVVACAYAWGRDWPRAGYFLSAAGISLSVLRMR